MEVYTVLARYPGITEETLIDIFASSESARAAYPGMRWAADGTGSYPQLPQAVFRIRAWTVRG